MAEPSRPPFYLSELLTLDLRPQWIAYCAFTNSGRLLDFGLTRIGSPQAARQRLSALISTMLPKTIGLRKISPHSQRSVPAAREHMATALALARDASTHVMLIAEKQLRGHFKALGARKKQEIAVMVAERFRELAWRLPPPRKRWQHEHQNMPIFDAASLGVFWLDSVGTEHR